MKITVEDVEYVRDLARNMTVQHPTPMYLNNKELPERHFTTVCFIEAVLNMLTSKNVLKEEVELNLKRTNAYGINDL